MKLLVLVLVAQLAGSAADADAGIDGGASVPAPFSDALYVTCPAAEPVVALDGGWVLMPPDRAARTACLLATCEAARKQTQEPLTPPSWLWWGVGLVVAGTAGYFVGQALPIKK